MALTAGTTPPSSSSALYDGGGDWEGALWRTDGPTQLDFLPRALRHYPVYAAGTPDCDADYAHGSRPARVRRAVEKVALTGRIGKPLITLHGTLDVLLPIRQDSDVYAGMVRGGDRGGLHRYYRIEGGTHTDSQFDTFPERLRPLTPCHRTAFAALERWSAGAPRITACPRPVRSRGPPGRTPRICWTTVLWAAGRGRWSVAKLFIPLPRPMSYECAFMWTMNAHSIRACSG
ncbi:hypothetical protein GCM10009801_20480 [Streptomyces albiaxialis]|uniref:Tannase n=1 Tax=Streptomyces albiaxialis TaxID=329523 RepID=A0ABN2VTA3_9ACTN